MTMADILIRGMENIPVGEEFVIVENIEFERYLYNRKTGAAFHLVSLPEGHGRLIDADALLDECCDVVEDHSGLDYVDPCPIWGYSANMINRALTIIPAEESDKEC